MRLLVSILIVTALVSTVSRAATIRVPQDHPAIQPAIDAAVNGDTILVSPGIYVENIDFVGKAVTLQSEQGPALTVIDGHQSGSVVIFENFEGQDSVLDGFTLTNGTGTYISSGNYYCGGGILTLGTSPLIMNNIIEGNAALQGGGGGIYSDGGYPRINGNLIRNNSTDGYFDSFGGGIYCRGSAAEITNNSIMGNYAFFDGGGVACRSNAMPLISGNLIKENTSSGTGGGILCSGSSPVIEGNSILDNTALDEGGGISCFWWATPTITANRIVGNKAGEGGGIGCSINGSPMIENNWISGNTADTRGGGFYCTDYCFASLVNNTITDNWAVTGGGIYSNKYSALSVKNAILWSNTATEGAEINVGFPKIPSTLTISHSTVKWGLWSVHVAEANELNWGEGMIEDDPLFVDPSNDDFHLTWLSPCINRGTDNGAPGVDFDGDHRPWMGTVDMGADEFTGTHPLEADAFHVSRAGGGISFSLNADKGYRNYLIVGSMSDTAPGTPLPKGGKKLRVNWDWFSDVELMLLNSTVFNGFAGVLDAQGMGSAQLNLPPLPSSAVGLTMHYAYCCNNKFDFVSNPVMIQIVP